MGTSADLAVRCGGRTGYLHTSYDGHIHSVLATMASTIAAAGVAALTQRLSEDPFELSDEEHCTDRRAMGNAYLLACTSRGCEPFLLDEAMTYDYGNPDFAHGGAISLFAPTIEWTEGFCDRIEDAGFVLDLDRGVLMNLGWEENLSDGSYDAGNAPVIWSLRLADIETMDPAQLFHGLYHAPLDQGEELSRAERQQQMDALLEQVRNQAVEIPEQRMRNPVAYVPLDDDEAAFPTVHAFIGANEHALDLQGTMAFFLSLSDELPIFAAPDTLSFANPQPGQFQVIVDLRQSTDVQAQNVVNALRSVLPKHTGMLATSLSPHGKATVGMYGMSSEASIGMDNPHWADELLVSDRWPPSTPDERQAQVNSLVQAGNTDALEDLRTIALVGFDGPRWQSLEDTGLLEPMSPKDLQESAALAVFLSASFERAFAGNTAKRFHSLSEGQRSAVLEALAPIDRHTLVDLLKNAPAKAGSPKP